MALSIGIVGLPNVGKSTLFSALTKIAVPIAPYPFTTIDPHVGVVAVPDERLAKLTELVQPERAVPATIEFVDVAGLIKGAAEGQGLGNQFLSHLYAVDALVFVLRGFEDPNISSTLETPHAKPAPEEELVILREELIKKDAEVHERSPETPHLSRKPALIVCNVRGEETQTWASCELSFDCKLELEMTGMSAAELRELDLTPRLPQLIEAAYRMLNLITFYTIKGGKELHAWPIKRGTAAPEAGGIVHSDFREKFIRADIIDCRALLTIGSWAKARELGKIRSEGKEYLIKDGEVIECKIG